MQRRTRFGALFERLKQELNVSTGDDLLWETLEEGLAIVHDLDWPWTSGESSFVTALPITPETTFTGTARSSSIFPVDPVTDIGWQHTGRKIKWGNELYRVVNMIPASGAPGYGEFVMDRPLGVSLSGQSVEFFRDEVYIKTPRIAACFLDGIRIDKITQEQMDASVMRYGTPYYGFNTGTPEAYKPSDSKKIPAPLYAPTCSNGAPTVGFMAGKYYYYFVRYDYETLQESEPGPVTLHTAEADKLVECRYTTMGADDYSYGFRLYRSAPNPTRERCAMYLVGSDSPSGISTINDTVIFNKALVRYYDGPGMNLEMIPGPDSQARTFVTRHTRGFNSQLAEDDWIEQGNIGTVWDALHHFCAASYSLRNRDAVAFHNQVIAFRGQLSYLSQNIKSRDTGDLSGTAFQSFPAGRQFQGRDDSDTSGDWVENLLTPDW